jgi:hypothetical protein
MNERVEQLLIGISNETLSIVARAVLDNPSAIVDETPAFEEITTSHYDLRTIGIVKVSGIASIRGEQYEWSSVVKFIDPSAGDNSTAVLGSERKIYELGLFSDPDVPFRAARFYLSNEHGNGVTTLWLEDLSHAPQPPWDLEQFLQAANHVGQFIGHNFQHDVRVPFETPSNQYSPYSEPDRHKSPAEQLMQARDSAVVQQAWGTNSVRLMTEFADLFSRIGEVAVKLPHVLSFGDCHSRNLFPVGNETVVIDWGAVGMYPNGADVGRMIGSALTYGVAEAKTVALNERAIFDSYVNGLKTTGWNGDVDEVRIGFYCQFAGYMASIGTIPIDIESYRPRQACIEGRFGVPLDDLPSHLAPIIALIPKYVDELKQLLD